MEENLFELRLYLYDSTKLNGLGTELQNVMIGSKISSCLDDTLDTAEITLNGIGTKDPYKPLTKFVAVLTQGGLNPQYFHYELRYDLVEKLSMSENLYRHTLSLGNPAISCQKRTCDNFAISYRLKDVTLDSSGFTSKYENKVDLLDNRAYMNDYPVFNRQVDKAHVFGSSRERYAALDMVEFIGGKYINWQRKSVGETSHIIASNDMQDVSNITQNVLIESSKMSYASRDKYVDWLKNNNISTKLQIFDYDSTNKVYGVSSGYSNYFESIPNDNVEFVSNGNFKYKIPYCMMWLSDCYNTDIESSSQTTIKFKYPYEYGVNNHLMLLPTITTIRDTNNDTLGYTETTIINIYGKDYQKANGFKSVDIPYYLDFHLYGDVRQWREYQPPFDQESMILLGFDIINFGKFADNKIVTPIYLKAEESSVTEFVEFKPQKNHSYSISTKPYFGKNGVDRYCFVPTNHSVDIELEETLYNGTGLANDEMFSSWQYYRQDTKNYLNKKTVLSSNFDYRFEISFVSSLVGDALKILKHQSTIPTCYDLFVKSQIASNTTRFDSTKVWEDIPTNQLPYVISDDTLKKMLSQNIIEDKYYNKNLWEMFMQIGKYIHAKPYIKFYDNKYELLFKDYGVSEKSSKEATQNSIFSSYNVESYISSLDNYLENYFEYGNEVEEFIRPTDNDGSSICVNDNAVLKTKYPIEEITYLGVASTSATNPTFKDITDYVYEYNVYKCLNVLGTSNSVTYDHFKGNSIYYHLGNRSIEGCQYYEPAKNGVNPYALKRIIGKAFNVTASNVQVNDYFFLIKYRTKDDVRFKTFKPDIRKFVQSSSTDQYPIQTQFNNQSDKIVDSQKYGNNVYGALLRSGNEDLEYQEYITDISLLKDSGELYNVNDNLYYVSKVTYAIYPTYINSQVNYTKDFNKLSEIIGIDSSPRFYEIPEDSSIKRNISIDRLLCVGVTPTYSRITNVADKSALERMYNNVSYKYCSVDFYGAEKSYNTESNKYHTNVCVPCLEYATANTLTFECDMEDNYGAGDQQLDVSEAYKENYITSSWLVPLLARYKVAYSVGDTGTVTERKSIQYCDVYGKADLISFVFLEDIKGWAYDWDAQTFTYTDFSLTLPNGDTTTMLTSLFTEPKYDSTGTNATVYYINKRPLGTLISKSETSRDFVTYKYVLDKDARETIGINFNVHLVTGSDQFVLSNNVFRKKRDKDGNYVTDYRWYFLSKEINKFERSLIDIDTILATTEVKKYGKDESYITSNKYLGVEQLCLIPNVPSDLDLSQVNAVAFGYTCDNSNYFIVARNVTGLTDASKKTYWYFTIVNN